jgi:hypothetical protein
MYLDGIVNNYVIDHLADSFIYLMKNINIPPKREVLIEVALNSTSIKKL